MRMSRRMRLVGLVSVLAVALSGVALTPPITADAVPGASFTAGTIITDQNFYNGAAMNAAQVQSFLNAQGGTCAAGYTCLKSYTQAVPSMAASSYCSAVTGGTMTAAQLITVIGAACNLSQKAIIVLLQKEQGLVTATAPSATKFAHATGFNCPDTAPCDPAFANFFYQVYYAARQFQVYRQKPASFNFRVGGTYQILYHPNAACGRKTVTITNEATAGLYNYTPYTPNDGALANLYGTGDSCSSYGNRNFWRLWWDWFGSPTFIPGDVQIANLYAAEGGATGWLGPATSAVTSVSAAGGGLLQTYQSGAIYWSPNWGAQTMSGVVLASYQSRGGPASNLGWPNGPVVPLSLNGTTGSSGTFASGSIYASTAGAFAVYEPMRAGYWSAVGIDPSFGWPTAEPVCGLPSGGCSQAFEAGDLFSSSVSGVRWLFGDFATQYRSLGGPAGSLGWPTGTGSATLGGSIASAESFQRGTMYKSEAGLYTVAEPMRGAYWSVLGAGRLVGFPTGNQVSTSARGGGGYQQFQSATVFWSSAGGPAVLTAAAFAEFVNAGGVESLGWPLGSDSPLTLNGTAGFGQGFQSGSIYESASGAFAVVGAVRNEYWASIGAGKPIGWPTSGVVPVVLGTMAGSGQAFQGGSIYQSPVGTFAVLEPTRLAYWIALGANVPLGWPVSGDAALTLNGTAGSGQAFQGGSIYRSAAGAYPVVGTTRDAYWAALGQGRPVGWPTASATCSAGSVCQQEFQGATITTQPGQPAQVVEKTPFAAAYALLGGASGPLGPSAGGSVSLSLAGETGLAQAFKNGSMYQSTAGTFAVLEPIRAAYWTALGQGRPLGWPTTNAVCDSASVCQQEFQGATITSRPGRAVEVIDKTPFASAYALLGGSTGPLGPIASGATSLSLNGETGLAQAFKNGSMYQSTAGTFAVLEPVRQTYWALLGAGTPLGWPTADQVSVSGGVVQTYQGGSIYRRTGAAAVGVTGAFLTEYALRGGPSGALGWPTGGQGQATLGGEVGVGQNFQFGTIYTTASGAYTLVDPIRSAFWTALGQGKQLGWPTSAQECGLPNGECRVVFQHGTIYSTATGGTRVEY